MTVHAKYATAVEVSDNSKIGPISCTSVAQVSCPPDCPFMDSGCYAESGFQGFTTRRLNASAEANDITALDAAKAEAEAIDGLTGELPLRLHVVGDCRNNRCAKVVSGAAERHKAKHNQDVYTYTHAWHKVNRESWRSVSVLASCEHPDDIATARDLGYATAIIVSEFESDKRYALPNGENVIPCPQQTGRAADCKSCKLCFRDSYLRTAQLTIGFQVHGGSVKKANNVLIQIGAV